MKKICHPHTPKEEWSILIRCVIFHIIIWERGSHASDGVGGSIFAACCFFFLKEILFSAFIYFWRLFVIILLFFPSEFHFFSCCLRTWWLIRIKYERCRREREKKKQRFLFMHKIQRWKWFHLNVQTIALKICYIKNCLPAWRI